MYRQTQGIMESEFKLKAKQLRVGDYLSEVQYYQIKNISSDKITLVNERGFTTDVDPEIVLEGMHSAGAYTLEKPVTRTEICEILEQAGNHIFTVNFDKKPQSKDIKDKLLSAIRDQDGELKNSQEIERALKQTSKEILQGDNRTLIGHLIESEPKMGRSMVIDLEVPYGKHRHRLIDHRTINWLILKQIKYVVK